MALKDVVGQEKALAILKGSIVRERMPHAMLFAGDEGIVKKLTALNTAKALNCLHSEEQDLFAASAANDPDLKADELDACDICTSCGKIDKSCHPDVFFIEPAGTAGQITVDAVRKLEEALSYKPFEGAWKVAVIDNAHMMNQSAANAFLKTLEEPFPDSLLILVSARPDMLLPTIRSRCQTINFSPLPVEGMTGKLMERFGYTDIKEARTLSLLAGGRLGYALNDDLRDRRDQAIDIFSSMIDSTGDAPWAGKDAIEEWIDWSQLVLRDVAVFNATGTGDFLINGDRADRIRELAGKAELTDILKLARDIYNIKYRLAFNLNKQLTYNYISLLIRKCLVHGRNS